MPLGRLIERENEPYSRSHTWKLSLSVLVSLEREPRTVSIPFSTLTWMSSLLTPGRSARTVMCESFSFTSKLGFHELNAGELSPRGDGHDAMRGKSWSIARWRRRISLHGLCPRKASILLCLWCVGRTKKRGLVRERERENVWLCGLVVLMIDVEARRRQGLNSGASSGRHVHCGKTRKYSRKMPEIRSERRANGEESAPALRSRASI